MTIGTALFIGGSALVGAGVGGVTSKLSGGDFWKGALVGGLTGAAAGGIGVASGGIGAAGGAVTSKAVGGFLGKTALASALTTTVATGMGMTKSKEQESSGKSLSAIEQYAKQQSDSARVKSLTVSELQQGNQNIYGTFGNTTSSFSRARLLNA